MIFQLGFKSPYQNIRMLLGNALVVCDLYDFWSLFSLEALGVRNSF